jgi:5-methylcytosine-specific restriction endonuclease McrA
MRVAPHLILASRCQLCGSMQQLEVHHRVFRSHGGKDAEENLVTLCHSCHSALHNC